jgi:protein-L-isoaspartate(D-aspartate) O-methyltransferase
MIPGDLAERVDELCDRLAAGGDLRSPVWRRALHAVPRHLFVPERAWAAPNGAGEGYLIDQVVDPDRWWSAVYSDSAIITQRADGAAGVAEDGEPSSSCSAPGTVAEFLEHLAPEDHNRVLEIGTGTGWTAALLSWRVRGCNVVSIDVDPVVSETAAKNLAGTDYSPRLVVGDGTAGWRDGAPYDRVHVAVGVAAFPYAWVEQTRPGGVIVAPFMPGYGFGWLARLHVLGDGTAVGRFPGWAGYMMLRGQRPAGGAAVDFVHGVPEETFTRLDPRRLVADSAADLAIAAMVPGVQTRMHHGDGNAVDECTLWVLDRETRLGSWASVDYVPGRDEFLVQQYGDRRLWDEVEAAYWRWNAWGRPERDRFGMTITPDGQAVWLDTPDHTL